MNYIDLFAGDGGLSEGFVSRFGLLNLVLKTQQRTIKDSGYWFRDFLRGEQSLSSSFVREMVGEG